MNDYSFSYHNRIQTPIDNNRNLSTSPPTDNNRNLPATPRTDDILNRALAEFTSSSQAKASASSDKNSSYTSPRPTLQTNLLNRNLTQSHNSALSGQESKRFTAPLNSLSPRSTERSLFSPSSVLNNRNTVPNLSAIKTEHKSDDYKLILPTSAEKEEVESLLAKRPGLTKKYDIVSLEKVNNPVLGQQFKSKMDALRLKATNPALSGSWDKEGEQETRVKVHSALESWKSETSYPNVYTIQAFHATKENILNLVLSSGLDFLGKTDTGYFGQGTYFTTYPEYGADVYGGSSNAVKVVLICEICFRTLFPVASCDNLMGASIKPGFDGHFVHVKPLTANPNEVVFISVNPFQSHKYDEVVVRDSSQIMIKYVMKITSNGLNIQQVKETYTGQDLQALIVAYLEKNPMDEHFDTLNEKLQEIKQSFAEVLGPNDYKLLSMLKRALEETGVANKSIITDRIDRLLSQNGTTLPAGAAPSSSDANNENLLKGDELYKKEKYEQAIVEYKKVLKKLPNSILAYVGCAQAYVKLKNLDEAIQSFNSAKMLDPKNEKVRSSYISCLINRAVSDSRKEKYGDAIKDLNEALKCDPNNVLVLGVFATVHYAKDEYDLAFTYCGRALAINANCDAALRVRGAIFTERGNEWYDKALEDLNKAIRLKPHFFAYLNRANLHYLMNHLKEAEEDCQEALKIDAISAQIMCILAKIHIAKKELKKAERILLKCDKNDPFVLYLLSEMYLQKKDSKEALKNLNKCITIYEKMSHYGLKEKVNYYESLLNRAETYHLLNMADEALEGFTKAIQLDPQNPKAYTKRRNFYKQRGETAKAQADQDKINFLQNK